MSYRRLTPEEIEDLRAEMRASGQWMKAELAERRRQRAESEAGAGSTESVQSPPMSNGKASESAPGDE
ncbi:hypothetical protein FGL86_08720 [Pistricoccus aurantiacus]|uniref:Uncharacterized protein n=1 Tax=Pistricoccus aurantiacus TaxID=1883414 RepID=A0A5B8SPX6_9GAMM|nr:hypothetical protein FGL86_08720 [Pistricoccus aurantiacus]